MLRILTILLALILLSPLQYAQEKNILSPDGKTIKHKGDVKNQEVISIKGKNLKQKNPINDSPLGSFDTLRYDLEAPFSNFGFFGQDWMIQWFEAVGNLNIREAGFACYAKDNPSTITEVKVVKCNWTREEFIANNTQVNWGHYEATGNGYNDITSFLDNPDRTGPWTALVPLPGGIEPFGNDLWSDGGTGMPVNLTGNSTVMTFEWFDLGILGYPEVLAGEIFGIAIRHTGATLAADRVGFWAAVSPNIPGWKFYTGENTNPGFEGFGWFSREFTWGFGAVVEYTSDVPPSINSFTNLGAGGVEVGPFTIDANITDINPIGAAGVASAYVHWSVDGGATWDSVAMSGTEPDYTGDIPAQSANSTVEYFVSATDVGGLRSETARRSFYIFAPTPGVTTLVVFNGHSSIDGYPQDYYWGPDVIFDYDKWAYGDVPDQIMDNYTNVIEFYFGNPATYNDDVIRTWLEGAGDRNYFFAGQEYLGDRHSFNDTDFVAGDFEYDIFGITHSYNDVSAVTVGTTTTGQAIPSLVLPQEGTLFGQPLLDLFNSLDPAADSLMYNPTFELQGTVNNSNWIDAFDVLSDVEVDLLVETRGIEGTANVQNLPTMAHRVLSAGNKIIFHGYDPLALNTAVDDDYPYYNWVGYDSSNSTFQAAFNWFEIPFTITSVEDLGGNIPGEFSLSQNYPNPFNPSTQINFSVPTTSFVTLKVYDVLGREVTTLINREMNSGNYKVDFDASDLASGLYIYKIQAGSFSTSKKMMLLK